jgi:6-carboxyhexanoate--CoA ligase
MKNLYSIRMRASVREQHISGAERIVPEDRLGETVSALVARASSKGCPPDQIVIMVDSLKDIVPLHQPALDVTMLEVPDVRTGRETASRILQRLGVSTQAVETTIAHLDRGASPAGNNMRGAMIIDARTGDRLEPDRERGVRASRFDWSEEAAERTTRLLADAGLTHFRTREALALATKVAHAPGMIAELCWSDDPDYTAGYVASLAMGYVRFPVLKHKGNGRGGRAFFVNPDDFEMEAFLTYLQTKSVLITEAGQCRQSPDPEMFCAQVNGGQPEKIFT